LARRNVQAVSAEATLMRSLNGYHKIVTRWLDELGMSYVEEYAVGPWSIDIYIADARLGIEVDGPLHRRAKDWERDKLIHDHFGIRIVRVKVGARKAAALEVIFGDSI
jgi:very-short-patch-repair endonuclease